MPAQIGCTLLHKVSSSGGMIHEWTHLIEAMQKEVASKGENAIILVAGERPNTSMATYRSMDLLEIEALKNK